MKQRGMTLIEIMVVIAIIGGVMGLAALYIFPGPEAKLSEEAVKLAGTVKALYDDASVKHRYYRIVFDLDKRSYSVESSTEPFAVALEQESKSTSFKPKKEEGGDAGEPVPSGSPEKGFTPDEDAASPVQLPEGIKFKDIMVMHEAEPRTAGIAYLYIFPNGWMEPVIVNLSDDDEENFMSLEFNPLTAKAHMRNEHYEINQGSLREGLVQP